MAKIDNKLSKGTCAVHLHGPNLRMERDLARLECEEYAAQGLRPLLVGAHSSEFGFWKEEGKGYHTQS